MDESIASPAAPVVTAFLALKPRAKGNSKKIARYGRFTKLVERDEIIAAENNLVLLAMQHRPTLPLQGPLRLDVTFVMPFPKSISKKRRAAALEGKAWPWVRPDRGNLLKLVEDALGGAGWYADDAQIVGGEVAKAFGEVAGYRLVLTQLVEID